MGWGARRRIGARSIALAYLIAAFIKTVMSRSFNEAAASPRSVIYGSAVRRLFQPFRLWRGGACLKII